MSAEFHGLPCWYELTTPDPAASDAFYGAVLGWSVQAMPMGDFDYHIATMGEAMVAGWMGQSDEGVPPNWCVYFAVNACDATAATVVAEGGAQIVAPADIPDTGRFAILADPQGAVFGLLQPDAPTEAYDPAKTGHGAWHELMTDDPVAALAFYERHFGWQQSQAMEMGEMGTYHIFARAGADLGGMMRKVTPQAPAFWLPYFNVASVDAAKAATEANGGTVHNGPMEVPGGAWVFAATDPQGAWFAVVGPR